MEQNREARISPNICSHTIIVEGTQWGEDNFFNKWCWEDWISTCKRIKVRCYIIPYLIHKNLTGKINTKWIKDLNVRPKTMKLLKENIGRKLHDVGFGNDFLDLTQKAKASQGKLGKWDYLTLLIFCTVNKIVNRIKDNVENEGNTGTYLQTICVIMG